MPLQPVFRFPQAPCLPHIIQQNIKFLHLGIIFCCQDLFPGQTEVLLVAATFLPGILYLF